MRKVLPALLMLLLTSSVVCAQNEGHTATDTNAKNASYSYYESVPYKAPNRNPLYYFGSPFAEHFAEIDFILGSADLGIGFTYTYLPEVWGGHITGRTGYENDWLMAGADYRLSKPWSRIDGHLYASAGCRIQTYQHPHTTVPKYAPALEAGIRIGSIPSFSKFCMTSAKVGVLTDFQDAYLTLGLSISLTAMASSLILLSILDY